MKVAVVCANGKAGQLITKELVERGVDTTAIVRDKNKSVASKFVSKNILDIKKEDLIEFDVVVDAFGTWAEEDLHLHSDTLKVLCDAISGSETRLMVVGGAGSLYINPEHTVSLSDAPDFPDLYKPIASAMANALLELRERNDVLWTYISPAGDFQADGERSGEYILAGEEFTLNDRGESIISYADYAIAMADEILNNQHIQERISVVRK
jgi:putative NADH-flavin reductase